MSNFNIVFRKQRTLGQILSDTFKFIIQEWLGLSKIILLYVFPFILMTGLITALLQSYIFNLCVNFLDLSSQYSRTLILKENLSKFLLYYFFFILSYGITYTVLISVIYSYITLYINRGKDNFTISQVWDMGIKNFLKILLTNIIVALIIIVATSFCCLPGVYFATSLSLILIILVYEKTSFNYAFIKSFKLTHIKWWFTLLLLIIVNLIVYLGCYIVSLIWNFSFLFSNFDFSGNKLTISSYDAFSPFILILLLITISIHIILSIVPLIALSFQYFNLEEKSYKQKAIR